MSIFFILLIIIVILVCILLSTYSPRLELFKMPKILILGGSGLVGTAILEIFKLESYNAKILIIDPVDNIFGFDQIKTAITKQNIQNIAQYPVDLIIDVSVSVDAIELIKICDNLGTTYINTSIENWEIPNPEILDTTPDGLYKRSLSYRYNCIKKPTKSSIFINCGMNPGNISFYVREGIKRMGKLPNTIHIAELDTQETNLSDPDTFYNTWSPEGFIAEGLDGAMMGLGKIMNLDYFTAPIEYVSRDNVGLITTRGYDTKANSYVLGKLIEGYVITHAESESIARRIGVNTYYVYKPMADIEKLKAANYKMKTHALRQSEIKSGFDAVGALLIYDDKKFWIGSKLSISDVKNLGFIHSGPTPVQVASCLWKIMHLNKPPGLYDADDLDLDIKHDKYLGPVVINESII